MRSRSLLGCLAIGLLAACGEELPPAHFDLFTIELVGLSEGDRVSPGQALTYQTRYAGDLVRHLRISAVFTHEASGESASTEWSDLAQDTNRIDLRKVWKLRHDFLTRPGRIRVHFQAALTATRKGSTPWIAESQSVHVELYPTLDVIALNLPASGEALDYGTAIQFRVTGKDLWDEVLVTVADTETGASLAAMQRRLPFDGSLSSMTQSWTLRTRELERVGTHRLRLVARYGELEAQSEPFAFAITHTVDDVRVLLRDHEGAHRPPTVPHPRLSQVTGLLLRISGTLLDGNPLTLNGGPPVTASGDVMEIVLPAPRAEDFTDGQGQKTYDYVVRSGGIERSASVTIQRWGIEGCEWRADDGRPLGSSERLETGAKVVMHATLWGFPDTTTDWWFFKRPQAEFTIWERDPGGRSTFQNPDPLGNNDDRVDSFDADVRSGQTEVRWTTVFDEEPDPLDLGMSAAEYYFEVWIEDQVCTSDEIVVR